VSRVVTGGLALVLVYAACGSGGGLHGATPARLSGPGTSAELPDDRPRLDAGQALMRDALLGMRAGRAAEMRSLWRRALVEYPAMRDYHLYYLGLAEASAGDSTAARGSFERLLSEEAGSVLRADAALQLGRLLLPLGPEDAAQRFQLAREAATPGSPVWVKASLLLARVEAERGRTEHAHAILVDVRSRVGPGVARQRARRAGRALAAADADLAVDKPERALEEARLLLREGDAASAEDLLRAALDSPRRHSIQPELLSAMATAQYDQEQITEAERSLQELLTRYPAHELAPPALMTLARRRWNRDDDALALQRFQSFVKRYPRHARVGEALLAVARIHQAAERLDAARATYQQIIRRFSRSEEARDARWRLAWLTYVHGDREAASRAFARLARTSGEASERERAQYWHARATSEVNGATAAQPLFRALIEEFPDGYYAIWAERSLADVGRADGDGTVTAEPVDPSTAQSGSSGHAGTRPAFARPLAVLAREPGAEVLDPERFARAAELDTMGLPHHATRELQALSFPPASQSGAQLILLEAYERVGAYRRALQLSVVRRPKGSPVGTHAMDRFAYPRGYWSLLNKYGDANRIDPLLVAAVIRQESAFDPAAVSPVGARGLMQLMPRTAARVAAGLGRPAPSARDLERPAVNIPLGTTYLGQLLTRYDGAIHRAVAAYNAGEDAVAKWDRRFGEAAPDEFVEQITYAETRNYVKSVLRGHRRYRSIYNGRDNADSLEAAGDQAPPGETSSGPPNDPEVRSIGSAATSESATAERRRGPRRPSRFRGPR